MDLIPDHQIDSTMTYVILRIMALLVLMHQSYPTTLICQPALRFMGIILSFTMMGSLHHHLPSYVIILRSHYNPSIFPSTRSCLYFSMDIAFIDELLLDLLYQQSSWV